VTLKSRDSESVIRKYQSRCYVIRSDLDQIGCVTDVCRIGRITRYKHFCTDSVMPRLTCWAYTALLCNSVKMAPSAETCNSFNGCNELYFIRRICRL